MVNCRRDHDRASASCIALPLAGYVQPTGEFDSVSWRLRALPVAPIRRERCNFVSTVTRWAGLVGGVYCGRGIGLRRVVLLCVASCCLVFAVSAGSASAIGSSSPGKSTASSDCSEATARQVVQRLDVNIFDLPDPVRQVLCGPFTGPGSNAMAVTIGAPTCWPIQNWAVFRFTAGDWQLVLNTPAYLVPPLVAVGSDIRETTGVHRSSDSRCFFNGGTRARIWHWDGQRLVAGPWKQITPGKAVKKDAVVFSPLRYGVTCHMTDDGTFRGSWVYCWIGGNPHPSRHVKLNLDGTFSVAVTTAMPLGLGGPVPPYGTRFTAGRFRCQSLRSGMKCTVITSGKGFLFNNKGARRVGP